MNRRRMISWIGAATVAICISPAWGQSKAAAPANAPTVKIAFIDPLSGPFAGVGANQLKHFQFVADIVNSQQLAGPGVKFELVPFDNKFSAAGIAGGAADGINQKIPYVI